MTGLELLVGGWFASPVIKSVLEKAQKHLEANFELQKGTQGMVETLTHTLVLTQATVKEVEKRTIINNPNLVTWLRMLKETVYDAEDVLDNMEAKSIKEKVRVKNKVSKLASSSLSAVGNMFIPDDNYKSLKKVVDKLKQLSIDIPTILKLLNMNKKHESQTSEVTNPRETISKPLEEVGLYGREDELNLILNIIFNSESKSTKNNPPKEKESSKEGGQNYENCHPLLVIPIVGMGGVGKTAIAQAVYNHREVRQTFSRTWISVSNKPDVVLVMHKIIQSLQGHRPDEITIEEVSKHLSSIIKRVKFLIVLDDMFEKIDQWEYLYATLSCGFPGSVVLITTQNQVFANRVGTFGPIALSALDSGIFWELFEHFAFGNVVMSEEKRIILKSIGNKIADKLHGLPLAAKIIGEVLSSDVHEDRWREVSKSEWWDIADTKCQILPSIGLGYGYLDPYLRQCFAYCSVFPRGSLIEKDRLVHMWIAQNFIQSNVNGVMKLEDIGRQGFDELVKKSFFQRAWDNKSYIIHDLMYDLAVIVSSGECFYLGEGSVEIPLGVRHLSVDTNNLDVIKGIRTHKNLRSFLYFGCCRVEGMNHAINEMLYGLDRIRVLDLSYMCMEYNSKPPSNIWYLQHLRFLDLSSTGIKLLTHSSIDLYHLQTLYIRKCEFLELPKGINKLINLRHLCADEKTIVQICGIGKLTNLQELCAFVVEKREGHSITELRNLREIRGTLTIKNFENIKNKDEAMLANLVDKKHLDSIYLYSSTTKRESNVEMEVLEGLQPHKDIKDLRIHKYVGSEFPNWINQIGDFLNLNILCLDSCVNIKVLPPLGELPTLKFLHMEHLSSLKLIDYHLYGKNQRIFPLLEQLVLGTLSKCEEWNDNEQAREFFPRLSKLTIGKCQTLREAPLHSFSSSLKELIIDECDSLISHENYISHMSFLTFLKLCDSITSVSFNPLDLPSLEILYLQKCSKLKIKGDLQSLTHLKRLHLDRCPQLFGKDQQKGKDLQMHHDKGLRSLTHVEADHSLLHHKYYHLILGSLPSLRLLKFKNSNFSQFTNQQNVWFQELTALKEIHFSYCAFEHLPASLILLSSLKTMKLTECSKLKSLSDSMPPNLQELLISDCSENLVQRCQPNEGEDWQFISSIPVIQIDGISIRKPKISHVTEQRACAS